MLPTIQEYKDSFRNPSEYFKNLQLGFIPSKFDENDPYFIAGGFACVFKVQQQNEFWAFKCFLQDDPHRNERLEILSNFLKERTETYFLPTHYYTDELWVCSNLGGDAEYPTLAMKWVEGLTLGEYVHKAAKDKNTQKLTAIYEAFLRLAHFLLTNDFAHGDLKHDNILVDKDENLILIDYDGMYLPSLTAFPSPELGGHGYQHPKRTAQDWGRHIDDFSILVILLSLRAYILLPSLIDDHKNENLLLTSEDLQNPMQSKPLQTLWQQNDEPLKHLLGMLLNSLAQNNLSVLEIGAFVERNLFDALLLFYDRNKNKKEFVFDTQWWNGLDDNWKDIFRENIKGKEDEVDFFERIKNLTKLNLSHYKLVSLINSVGNLVNLNTLNLGNNNLTSLPKNIGNLINLIELDLRYNQLTELPESIGNLTKLTTIYLHKNQLTSLPESTGNLTNLNVLDLEVNQLTKLPKSVVNLINLTTLYLGGNEFTELPKNIGDLINLKQLALGRNQFIELPRLENLTNLTALYLHENQFTEVPSWISNLNNLTGLHLRNNQFTSLPENIGNLTNLKKLDLRNNQITFLPNSIGSLTNLIDLRLDNNQLISLPENIGNLNKLTHLFLSGNPFSNYEIEKIKKLLPYCNVEYTFFNMEWWNELSKEWKNFLRNEVEGNENEIDFFDKISNIEVLNISHDTDKYQYTPDIELTSLPNWIRNLTNLTTMDLYGNHLSFLPESIENLINLENLNLQSNRLTELPESIGNLNKITKLNLASNQLTSLPNELESLINLNRLYLGQNQLTSIPKSIGNLISLTNLQLWQNQLTSMPNELGNLINLTNLGLSNNQLTSISESIGNLRNLTELDLSSNQLTSLPESIGNLRNLTELDLSSNQLTSLPESIGNLTNLTILSLSLNRLTSLPDSIRNLNNLTKLYLRNTQLTTLPEGIGNLINLKELDLYSNRVLKSLPESIRNLDKLIKLNLQANLLPNNEIEKIKKLLPNCKIYFN